MPTIAANTSTTLTIPAGQRLTFLGVGSGVATLGPGPSAGTVYTLGANAETIGPFETARVVYVSANGLLDYAIQAPPFDLYEANGSRSIGQIPGTQAIFGPLGRIDGLVPRTPSRILKRCTDTVGVGVANSGTAATVSIDASSPFGRPAYRVQMPAGNTWHEVTLAGLNIAAFDGHVIWRVWVNDYTTIQQIQTFAGTSGYTRFWQGTYRLNNSNENRWNGEHILRAGPTFAGVTNSFVRGVDTMADCKIRIFPGAAGADLWVDAIFVPAVGRPTHCLTYDDCSVTWITNVLPALADRGLPGTFGINTGSIGTNAALFLSGPQVRQIALAGHQVSPHNVTDTPFNDGTGGTQTAAQYTADFVTSSAALSALVGSGLDTSYHAWVQGRNNVTVHDTMRAAGLRIGRGTDSADGYNFPQISVGNGVFALKNQSVHTLSEAQIDAICDNANRYGLTIAWMIHEVTPNGGIGVETSIARHRYLLQRIASDRDNGIAAVRTMGELGRELYSERLVTANLLP